MATTSQVKRENPTSIYEPRSVNQRTQEEGRKRMKAENSRLESEGDLNPASNMKAENDSSVSAAINPNSIAENSSEVNGTHAQTFPDTSDPNSIGENRSEVNGTDAGTFPYSSGGPNRKSAKSILLRTCAAKNWKRPVFECCGDEGLCHRKLFTYKVIVEIEEGPSTILECLSAPWPKKKTAAEHAAEGALWYLKNLGYVNNQIN